jgi:hypothetical protein
MRPSVPEIHITDPHDADLAKYRVLAGQAILGLLFGLLAPLALVDPMLWGMPALGVIFSGWALRRIRKNVPAMTGGKMALTGLVLSLFFLSAAPANWLVYRSTIRNEARQFAELWFKYLTHDEPQKAYQLMIGPQFRRPLDDRLWDYYRSDPESRKSLEECLERPLIRTLLALGQRGQVRFYQTIGQTRRRNAERISQLYAVTYEEKNERKSFFVLLQMARTKLPGGGADWYIDIDQSAGGVRPEGW